MPISFPVNISTFFVGSGPDKKVFYPQVFHLRNPQLQHLINQSVNQQTQQLINQQVGNMPSTVKEMLGSYEIKNNQRQVLSLSLSNYTYHDRAAHGMTFIKSLTFDLEKGTRCELKDLFKSGSDYVNRLSTLIQEQIKERDIQLISDFTTIAPDQDFYVADKTLVIYFQLYDITPYVFGFPMFPISVYDIQDIIDENGPLGRLAENN
ncbi:DUF3298 domain-containing protein [Ferdinandcohnia sp. Marseille-Q9671]